MNSCRPVAIVRAVLMAASTLFLVACDSGGGSDDPGNSQTPVAVSCDLRDQQTRLADYMQDEYFWYASMPNPSPTLFTDISSYFYALRFTGDAALPRGDIWSHIWENTAYNDFFYEGQVLGWGLGLTWFNDISSPGGIAMLVRYVEEQSPAAQAGMARGDTLVSINGTQTLDYYYDPYALNAALTVRAAGDVLNLVVRNAQGIERDIELAATLFPLTPVPLSRIVNSPAGTPIGYVMVQDFIAQIQAPLEDVFADFKANGVNEIVLDLRYNSGGWAANARRLASYAGGSAFAGNTFAWFIYNDKHQQYNHSLTFEHLDSALPATRVFVLTGASTCSASELVINSLAPYVEVIQIGGTTCGKPVGFNSRDNQCGMTYSAVNFEALNANGEGRYWGGLAPRCAVDDDLSHALGDDNEALLATARQYVDQGACPLPPLARKRATDAQGTALPIRSGVQPPTMILP